MERARTATAMAAAIRSGEDSAVAIAQAALDRSHIVQAALNCFTEIYDKTALAEARRIDGLPPSERAALPLCGVPVAIKDFTPIAGKLTTFGSKVYRDHVAESDALIVRRLRAAGAVILGHTTTPEFAWSSATRSPLWGMTRNPYDATRSAGGSSGGSAVAVATGCVPLAEGTDMGGSVRIPASLCGVIGLKPSFGRIPMDILRTQYDTLAHFGPLARSVADAALFLSACEGPDESDALSLPPLPPVLPLADAPRRPRLATSVDLDFYAVDANVVRLFEKLLHDLADAGAEIVPIKTPFTVQAAEDWGALWNYCFAGDIGFLLEEHRDALDPQVVGLIEAGRKLDAVGLRAIEHRRTALWRAFAPQLARFDALLCPTTTMTAPPVGTGSDDVEAVLPDGRFRSVDMTGPFNLMSGCPVVSVPMGLAENGLPAGMQVVGQRHDDRGALAIAAWIERLRPAAFPQGLGVVGAAS